MSNQIFLPTPHNAKSLKYIETCCVAYIGRNLHQIIRDIKNMIIFGRELSVAFG